MHNTKLVKVLRTFSKSELKEFEKFISSPFFNKGRNYIPFLNELKKFYPKFDDEKMTQEFIYSMMYPNKKFNKQIVWNLTSGMMNMIEDFLMVTSMKQDKFTGHYALAKEYYVRKLPKYLLKTINEMEGKLDLIGIENDYFLHKMQLEYLNKSYNYMQDTQHLVPEHILKEGEYSVLYFLHNMSGYIVDMRSSFLYFNAAYEINMPYEFLKNIDINKIVDFVKKNSYRYSWIMEMYYLRMMLILDFDNDGHFYKLKQLLIENGNRFKPELKFNWIISLSNYCIMKINKGIDFRKQLFEMNELNLKTGIVYPGRYFLKTLFLQILRSALAVDEVQWSKNFIQEYVPKLKPSYQKPMHAFSNALLFFKLREYDKVIENLSKVEFVDARDKIDARIVYLKTYYELNEIETVISLIDSTKHFVSKNTAFTEISKENFIKSVNYLNRLINARMKNDSETIDLMLIALKNEKGLVLRSWLEEKISELKAQGL